MTCKEILEDEISIHAPHEGERLRVEQQAAGKTGISIHAPHEGERPKFDKSNYSKAKFQSTLPTRGSDRRAVIYSVSVTDFNPRSPRGGATPR